MKIVEKKRIRYGVVGAGWISQSVFMPAVEHTGNSVMTALVTGDTKKAQALAKKYKIKNIYSYDDYEKLLASGEVDALYIALPNWMHAKFTIPALEAGISVLLEKPMAVSTEECIAIDEAAWHGKAKLMIAYRLHFEPATLTAIARVRAGEIGEPRYFSALMGQRVEKGNHRAQHGFWAGPVADMGPYPINAARNLFGAEPIEVIAIGAKNPELGFNFHDTVTVVMRFPGEKLAQFTVSYNSSGIDVYRIVGTEGDLQVQPGFTWGKPIEHHLTTEGKTHKKTFKPTDHFGGETKYFSDCVLRDLQPEPDGEEGLADVRIVCAIEESLKTGLPQKLEKFTRKRRPEASQAVKLPLVKEPKLVNASAPGG